MNAHDITLLDDEGITWVRHACRCCHCVLWAVLGEPCGLCAGCDIRPIEPLGLRRLENEGVLKSRVHVRQYHGELLRADV